MNVATAIELENIENAIERQLALLELCEKWNAGDEAIEEARTQLRQYENEKAQILGQTITRDESQHQMKMDLFKKVYEALESDPDQQDNVSWWAS
jgi:hypothetical protein